MGSLPSRPQPGSAATSERRDLVDTPAVFHTACLNPLEGNARGSGARAVRCRRNHVPHRAIVRGQNTSGP